ncbi:MAG: carbohydrate-binding domain-containing protein [Eubacteriales bacterium]|nr:carbohydrate-binding domain-containing protein [Eubacteriales bacterium]MDD4421709.1 carbohydrate-binding domain-containing protein [Eubacteriales bacterium]HBR32669.1 hypothetical protein [Clostridiales bacterium]
MINRSVKTYILLFAAVFALTSCSIIKGGESDTDEASTTSHVSGDESTYTVDIGLDLSIDPVTEDEDDVLGPDDGVLQNEKVIFSENGITVESGTGDIHDDNGSGASVSDRTVTITEPGVYTFNGSLTDGQIIVDADKEDTVELVLGGVTISSDKGAAIYGKSSGRIIITLADGTDNTVSDAESYENINDDSNAAIYSKDDIVIKGKGSLVVNGNYDNGISSSNDIKFIGGKVTVNSVNTAIRGKDSVKIGEGTELTVSSGGDAIKATDDTSRDSGFITITGGVLTIRCDEDGIEAYNRVAISAGIIDIITGGGSGNTVADGRSAKAVKSDTAIEISGGKLSLNSADKAMKSDGHISITDGEFKIDSCFDGIESEGMLSIANGSYEINAGGGSPESSESRKALKSDAGIIIGGGSFVIVSSDDAVHCAENLEIKGGSFTISSQDDAIHADKAVLIFGGKIDVLSAFEGLEGSSVTISGGHTRINASDDGINTAGGSDSNEAGKPGKDNFAGSDYNVAISDGYVFIDADGDGIDANGAIEISGGTLIICGPTENDNSTLDYNKGFKMSGGLLVASGSSGMAQGIGTNSTQYGVLAGFAPQAANTLIRVQDSDGNDIVTFSPNKQYSSLVICTPKLEKDKTYTIMLGGSCTGDVKDGLYSGGDYSGGTKNAEFTVSSVSTVVGEIGGMGDPRGPNKRR